MPLLEGSFASMLMAAATGRLADGAAAQSNRKSVGVVIASRGYPASSESGRVIDGVDRAAAVPGVVVFHAGTRITDGRLVSAGGRVLTVVATAESFGKARDAAYRGVDVIQFDGAQCRRDIGRKAIEGR
jgi:phosphoribosylamine--glycine ligase